MTVRVVLADDHPMYRYGLGAVLEQAESVEVVASVGDWRRARARRGRAPARRRGHGL